MTLRAAFCRDGRFPAFTHDDSSHILKNCCPVQCRISQLGLVFTAAAEPSITRPASTETPRAMLPPQGLPAQRRPAPRREAAENKPARSTHGAPKVFRHLQPLSRCLASLRVSSLLLPWLSRLCDGPHGLSLALPSRNLKNCRLMQCRNSRPGLVFTAAAAPSLTRPASTPRLGRSTKQPVDCCSPQQQPYCDISTIADLPTSSYLVAG